MDSLLTRLDQRLPALNAWATPADRRPTRIQEQLAAIDQDARTPVEGPGSTRHPDWLPAAISELHECAEEAEAEGYPEPTPEALATAEAILKRIRRLPAELPEPSVYPSADREIVVFFCRSEAKAAVSLSIDADGGGACFSNIGGLRRARYGNVMELPDAFVQSELLKLSRLAAD